MQIDLSVLYIHLALAIISAKWAMDLDFSQVGQLLWGIAGFLLGPLILLILYVRMIRRKAGWG
jgi:hypothetical protein